MTKRLTKDEYLEIRNWMLANFPETFGELNNPRPLGRGIMKVLPSHISRNKTRRIVDRWTKRFEYRCALAAGGPRYDLEGHICGEVEPHERAFAVEQINQMIASLRSRKQEKLNILAENLENSPKFAPYRDFGLVPAA